MQCLGFLLTGRGSSGPPFFPSAMEPDPPAHTHSQISAEVPLRRSPEAISSSNSLVRRYLCKPGTKVVVLAGTWEALLWPSLPLKQGWESGGRGADGIPDCTTVNPRGAPCSSLAPSPTLGLPTNPLGSSELKEKTSGAPQGLSGPAACQPGLPWCWCHPVHRVLGLGPYYSRVFPRGGGVGCRTSL